MAKKITFSSAHRQKHFEFFKKMNHPHFNICANVDITILINELKNKSLPFTPSIVFFVSKIANQIKEFRWRLVNGEVIEHERIHPSFTVYTDEADVFSFCEVRYQDDFIDFISRAATMIEERRKNPSFEDEASRSDYLYLSAIPWVSFTSFQHAMHYHPTDSVPRITWGKYFTEGEKILMPLSVQVHHALVDGRHVGKFFQEFGELVNKPDYL